MKLVVFLFYFVGLSVQEYNDTRCSLEFVYFKRGFRLKNKVALELYDTWAKLPVMFPQFNTVNFGDYEGCLNFNRLMIADNPADFLPIQGQYCMVNLYIKLNQSVRPSKLERSPLQFKSKVKEFSSSGSVNIGFHSAFCVPSSCSPEETINYLNEPIFLLPTVYEAVYAECQTLPEPIEIETVDIVTAAIFTTALSLIIASTIYEASFLLEYLTGEPNDLFTSFSIYRNGQRLFDMSPSTNAISCLHGLRALSILWIMFGHRVSNQLNFPLRIPTAAIDFYQQTYSVILSSYSIAVDTFFLMGALLVTISTLRAIDKNRLNIPRMILHRYLRYTPVLAVAILCTIALPKYLISGPLQSSSVELRENCVNYWWSAILHIQNYVNPDKLCLNHSWYLAVDFQLFVITPFLILAIKKYKWVIWMIPGLIGACTMYIFTISIALDIYKSPRTDEMGENYHRLIYHPTHARIQSWFVGISLGFLLHNKENLKFKVSKLLDGLLWVLSISVIIATILLSYQFANPTISYTTTLFSNAFFMSFHRVAWSMALSYMIYACEHLKSGKIIRDFLSHSSWKPLGTAGLSLYITHLIFMLFVIMNQRQPFDFTLSKMLHTFSGDLLPCFIIAIFFYLAFEAPILIVENYLYNKIKNREE